MTIHNGLILRQKIDEWNAQTMADFHEHRDRAAASSRFVITQRGGTYAHLVSKRFGVDVSLFASLLDAPSHLFTNLSLRF